jgi:hypothetical protein
VSTAGPEGPPLAAPLARRLGAQPTAAQIAAAVFIVWEEFDDVLTPIIGTLGVVALYRRSLHLTRAAHPWMAAAPRSAQPALPPAALRSLLAAQDSAVAATAGSTFLQSFHAVLASVVGASLTERLLRSVWADPSSGAPAKDPSP